MALRDQPYLPLFIKDFMTDEKLAECSAAATGVYIRIMCLMHKSEHYGKILLKQKYKQSKNMCLSFASMFVRQMPYDLVEIEQALIELTTERVLLLDGDCLVQKRMVKDGETSAKRSKSGKKGGNPNLKKDSNFAYPKVQAKAQANTEYEYAYNTLNSEVVNKEENKGSDIKEKAKEKPVSPYAHQSLKTIDECKAELMKDQMWLESVAMLNGIRDLRQVEVWLVKFIDTIKADGETHKGLAESKKHFNRWLQNNKDEPTAAKPKQSGTYIPVSEYGPDFDPSKQKF